jgi:hypothetical protein
VTRSKDPDAVESAIAEVLASAQEFRRSAGPAITGALHRRLEDLVRGREEFAEMTPEVRTAFDEAAGRAITQGAEEAERRLAKDDLWLDPLTAPGLGAEPESGWDGSLPEWLIGVLRRLTPKRHGVGPGELDHLNNRVWIAMLAAADPLDPVLEEFGLTPSEIPNMGGGNFGLAPPTATELDPTGTLVRSWDRYRVAYLRYRAVAEPAG